MRCIAVFVAASTVALGACSDEWAPTEPDLGASLQVTPSSEVTVQGAKPDPQGVITANGWYETEEIYYILGGVEEDVTERGRNQLYLIGGDRAFQANVALFIPGESGYSPHWNVNVVHTAEGVTVQDIIDAGYASQHFGEEPVLFDDVEDILAAMSEGLVTIDHPGVVVLCPIISEKGAEAPGNTELPDDVFPNAFVLSGGF